MNRQTNMPHDGDERFDYMNPDVPANLPHFEIPLIKATPENFAEYGTIVTDFMNHPVPITQWPHQGSRPVDVGTGDEGGYLEGIFEFWWEGDVLLGENMAVKDKYILGWSTNPEKARTVGRSHCRQVADRPRQQTVKKRTGADAVNTNFSNG